jgi:mono/diheme cytochrome c family protein
MQRFVKFTAGGLLLLVLLAGVLAGAGVWLAERKLQRRLDVELRALSVAVGSADVARGRYLFQSRGCGDCHGADGGGRVFAKADNGLRLRSPNISGAPASAVARYTDRDWDRTVRHGIKPDGRPLFVMPSEEYAGWSDADLAALIAYARTLPPAPGGAAEFDLPLVVRLAYGFGQIRDAADKIDHARAPAPAMQPAASTEYGAYVAQGCTGCHGAQLTGGRIPGGPPDWPAAADLSADGPVMPRYDSADKWLAMLRTGKRPDGSAVSPVMPFESLKRIDDIEAEALRLYLRAKDRPGAQPVAKASAASGA